MKINAKTQKHADGDVVSSARAAPPLPRHWFVHGKNPAGNLLHTAAMERLQTGKRGGGTTTIDDPAWSLRTTETPESCSSSGPAGHLKKVKNLTFLNLSLNLK